MKNLKKNHSQSCILNIFLFVYRIYTDIRENKLLGIFEDVIQYLKM